MTAIEDFKASRAHVLGVPAPEGVVRRMLDRFGSGALPLAGMYSLFNGEVAWGTWVRGYRIDCVEDVFELMEDTSESWELEEEAGNDPHWMRTFVPIISSSVKTSIGPVFVAGGPVQVIEYHYETGQFRRWSRSLGSFLDAFFSWSLRFNVLPESLEQGFTQSTFSESDKLFLAQWSDVVFPVVDEAWQMLSAEI